MTLAEVPSPIDFHDMRDALEWESTAMDRPFRLEMFDAITDQLATANISNALELGSGPGFLANHICNRNDRISLALLDFSTAMHELARARLWDHRERISFLEKDFKESNWAHDLDPFECVITNQAVHELRHKSHAAEFHKQVKGILAPGGIYLVCDHFYGADGMSNDQLYMTVEEHSACLTQAGFENEILLKKGSLVLFRSC